MQKAGGWVERKYGTRKRYVKLHSAMRIDIHEIVAMEVYTDDTHDVKTLPGLVESLGGAYGWLD